MQPVCSCSPSSRLSSTQQRPWTSPQIHCSCWPATGQTTSASYLEAQTSRLHQHPAASQQVCNDVETQALCLQGAVLGQFVFFSVKMCHHSACKSSKDKHPPPCLICPHRDSLLSSYTRHAYSMNCTKAEVLSEEIFPLFRLYMRQRPQELWRPDPSGERRRIHV